MPTKMTPVQRLATIQLGRPLIDYVTEKRNGRPKWTWEDIAAQLSEDTNGETTLTAETIRGWYVRGEL